MLASVKRVFEVLAFREQTLSVVESCTGGKLSGAFAELPGVSSVFHGGLVVYSNRFKELLLKIDANLLVSMGAVSLPVAREMARQAKKELGTHWAVSVTGIAGPSGGSSDKPVGTVCFAVCGPGVELLDRQQFSGDRLQVQAQAVEHAVQMLERVLIE